MEKNDIEHYHKRLTDCEIDSFLYFKACCEVVKNNHDISLRDAYNRQYERLIAKYTYEEVAANWKPFAENKSNLSYHRKKSKPAIPKETKDIQINEIYANINNQQFLQFDNLNNSNRILIFMSPIGFRILTNSKRWHLDATSNNVLALINMIKKSETETCNRFYNTERNPIEEPKQLPKNKRKDDILARLKVQYTKNIITIEQYFEKPAAHIVDPYEAVKIKFDLDGEVKDEIETGKKRKRKVVFENPLKNQKFMDRIDFINFNIWPKPQVQISNFFSIEMFTVLKTQIHIYNNFIVKYQPVRKDLFDALQLYTSQHLMKYEQVEFEPIDQPKRAKLDDIGDIQFSEVRFWSQYERIPISMELLQLNHSQCQSLFVQVLHARDHWVVVSNYNPSYVDSDDGYYNWFLYDSMNNPEYYLNFIKPALKRLSGGSRFFNIINVEVSKQKGTKDCGLFALGYSLTLAMDIDPGKLGFDQNKIRSEFSEIIKNQNLYLFPHALIVKKFIEKCEDLAKFSEENELIQPDISNYTVGKILLKCRSIVCSFNHSTQLKELLEEQQKGETKILNLVQDVKTRWHSTFAMNEDAIAFWKNNIYEYPILSILASVILAAPATSVPSKRLFSHAGYQLWDRRKRLSKANFEKIMFLYENKDL
ncbi:zinc finger BED domain-containing 1-like [Brachionus plicatilis]|uniref:Zinc finger BED domain-containing 1-like n=1 Tax=Brachionus plicatilis TaxID=10195 RepID=A0A3M7RKY7_BRAPC|nr:zinc finger BED domain-containing 1-like [Brachionus plicatilis]